MKVYLAGPMRGIPEFNFPAFAEATRWLRTLGHEVFSPAEKDLESGWSPEGLEGTEEELARTNFDLRNALGYDVDWICEHAEGIALLPGWSNSSGAKAELALAAALDLRAGIISHDEAGFDARWLPAKSVTPADDPSNEGLQKLLAAIKVEGELVGDLPDEVRVTSDSGAEKGSKLERFDLIPVYPLRELARLFGKGAEKYDDRNWEKGYNASLSYAALLRHLTLWWGGEDMDEEMGVSHLTCVAWHAFALLETYKKHNGRWDDRP